MLNITWAECYTMDKELNRTKKKPNDFFVSLQKHCVNLGAKNNPFKIKSFITYNIYIRTQTLRKHEYECIR